MRANGSSPCCHLRGMWTPGPDAPSETGLKWHHAIVPGVVSRLAGGGAALRPSPSDSLDHDICIPQWFCSLQRRRHAARFDSSVIRLCGMRHACPHTQSSEVSAPCQDSSMDDSPLILLGLSPGADSVCLWSNRPHDTFDTASHSRGHAR